MFKKHDKILFVAQLIFWIITALIAGGSVIMGIIFAIGKAPLLSILVIVGGLFGSFVFWVLTTLLISYLKDVKLIRNKLYGIGMEGLEVPPSEYNNDTPRNQDGIHKPKQSNQEEKSDEFYDKD